MKYGYEYYFVNIVLDVPCYENLYEAWMHEIFSKKRYSKYCKWLCFSPRKINEKGQTSFSWMAAKFWNLKTNIFVHDRENGMKDFEICFMTYGVLYAMKFAMK